METFWGSLLCGLLLATIVAGQWQNPCWDMEKVQQECNQRVGGNGGGFPFTGGLDGDFQPNRPFGGGNQRPNNGGYYGRGNRGQNGGFNGGGNRDQNGGFNGGGNRDQNGGFNGGGNRGQNGGFNGGGNRDQNGGFYGGGNGGMQQGGFSGSGGGGFPPRGSFGGNGDSFPQAGGTDGGFQQGTGPFGNGNGNGGNSPFRGPPGGKGPQRGRGPPGGGRGRWPTDQFQMGRCIMQIYGEIVPSDGNEPDFGKIRETFGRLATDDKSPALMSGLDTCAAAYSSSAATDKMQALLQYGQCMRNSMQSTCFSNNGSGNGGPVVGTGVDTDIGTGGNVNNGLGPDAGNGFEPNSGGGGR